MGNKIIYDSRVLDYIRVFESLTGASVKDCIVDDSILLIVEKGQMGLAIGKGGRNLKRVEGALKKSLRVVEYDSDISAFIKNYVYPLKVEGVSSENGSVVITGKDAKVRGKLIGRDKANLKRMISIVKRHFDVNEISVS